MSWNKELNLGHIDNVEIDTVYEDSISEGGSGPESLAILEAQQLWAT